MMGKPMNSEKLYVSFWHICLDNLPEGTFKHSKITLGKARRLIERTRAENTLFCVSDDDLLAPYHKKARDDHEALAQILTNHYGIMLSLEDFCGKTDGDESLYFITPLNCVQVQDQDRLMVVTCDYTLTGSGADLRSRFNLEPTTVEFHLFEAM